MRENTFSKKAMLIFSLALLILIIVVFSWIWFGRSQPSSADYRTSENLKPVNVSGLDSQAEKLLDGLKNNSGIPIPEPVSKEGRTDPFASL